MKLITDKNYNKTIIDQTTEKPFIIFFESKTCPHCVTVKEILKKMESDKEKPCEVDIYQVLAEDSRKLVEKYGIRSFPTTLYFCKNRSVRYTIIGAQSPTEFVNGYQKLCKGFKKNSEQTEKQSLLKKLFGK